MSISYAKKRRILLFVLLFPTIFAIVLITVLGNQQARAKHDAKKWLKENRPKTELISVSLGETKVDGVVTEKSLHCKCFDTEYGFYYSMPFVFNGVRYVPDDVPGEYESPTSYAAMTETVSASQYLGNLLAEEELSCDVLWYPTNQESRIMVLTTETDTKARKAVCEATEGAVKKMHGDGIFSPEILVCTDSVRDAILSADRAAVWRRLEFSLPNAAGNAAAALLGKGVTVGTDVRGSFESIIETAQQTAMPDDKTMWQITPDGDTASMLIYTLT